MSGTTNGKSRISSALDLYESTNKHIDDSVSKQQQKADVNYQRLMKYLPTANKVNGITGGLSESSMLEATVAHQNKLADIEAEGEAQKLTAKKEYDQSVLNAYAENYALASDTVNNWTGNAQELETYLGTVKGTVSDAQYANLENYAKDVKATITEQETEESEITENLILGDGTQEWIADRGDNKYEYGANFHMKYDGKDYKLEMGYEVTDTDSGPYKAVAQGKVQGNNTVFVYGDKLYYTNDGQVFEVYNSADGEAYERLLKSMKSTRDSTRDSTVARENISRSKRVGNSDGKTIVDKNGNYVGSYSFSSK